MDKKETGKIVSKVIRHRGKPLSTQEIASATPVPMPETTAAQHEKAKKKGQPVRRKK